MIDEHSLSWQENNKSRFCQRRGKKYVSTRNNQRYCTDCAHAARKAYWKDFLFYVLFGGALIGAFLFLALLSFWSGGGNWPFYLAYGGLVIVVIVQSWRHMDKNK